MKPFPFLFRILALVPTAVLVTLATGEFHINNWGWGLPLPWKVDFGRDCPSPLILGPCPLVRTGIVDFIWFFFVLDYCST